jgi:NitT/TauT family transport system substrate-binding protein
MKRRSMLTTGLLFFMGLSVPLGCSKKDSQVQPQNNSQIANARIGFSAWPGWLPWQVTNDKELFDRAKVSVNLKWFDSYNDSIAALNAGTIDANSQTLADTINSISKGKDLVIVLTNDNSTGNDQLIISDRLKSAKDLKGKKVAAEEGTVDHFLLVQVLKQVGMTIKDIEFVPMETSKAADAFVAGKVDAVAVFAPFTTRALKRPGSRMLFSSKDFPGSISDHLVFSRKYINEHPDKVQAIVNSWFETLNHMDRGSNKNEANAIMAKRAGVTLAEYQEYLEGTKIFSVEENLEAFKTGADNTYLPQAAAATNKFLFENGLIAAQVDVSKLFDDRFVKAYAAKLRAKEISQK